MLNENLSENKKLESFNRYISISKESYQALKNEVGKNLIGYTLGDVPRELIHAAGFNPVGVMGWSEPADEASAYLQSFCCSLMRTTLDIGLCDASKSLSGMILGHICDTTRDFSGIWQRHVKSDFFHDWMPPKQLNRPSARVYLISELERLKKHLEEFSGSPISDSTLESSLNIYEQQRQLLENLKILYLERPGLIKAQTLYTIMKAALFMKVEEFNPLLTMFLEEIKSIVPSNQMLKAPVILAGKIPEPLEVISIIEDAGGFIADDDFLWGSRIIRQTLPDLGTPLVRICARFLKSEPFPGYLYENPARWDFLWGLAQERRAAGVIFWDRKFCEPYNFDYPDLKKYFTQKGIPTLSIQTEMHPSGLEQLKTRIQAFFESLTGRSL